MTTSCGAYRIKRKEKQHKISRKGRPIRPNVKPDIPGASANSCVVPFWPTPAPRLAVREGAQDGERWIYSCVPRCEKRTHQVNNGCAQGVRRSEGALKRGSWSLLIIWPRLVVLLALSGRVPKFTMFSHVGRSMPLFETSICSTVNILAPYSVSWVIVASSRHLSAHMLSIIVQAGS